MSSEKNIEFLELFNEVLQSIDLPTAYQIRNLTLNKITELEQGIIEARLAFRKATLEKAAELGVEISDLLPPKEKVKAEPKYQTLNPLRTWSGKGKPPKWVKAALDSGKTLDDLLIPTPDVDPEAGF